MSVKFDTDGAVAVITLDRPEALNALSIEALRELRARLTEFRDNPQLRAAVITGQGARAFCVGADLKNTRPASSYPAAAFKSTELSADQGVYVRLMDLTELAVWKPLIAAVNGHCLGGGLELALQCDIRLASTTATFGLPEAKIGSIPGVSGLQRLMNAVPASHAMQMALSGERIPAQAAERIGLVSEVCEPDALLGRALELAQAIATNAPLAVQAIKRLARQSMHLSETDAQHLTELYWGALRDTEDRAEGRQAFADKRPPRFQGR